MTKREQKIEFIEDWYFANKSRPLCSHDYDIRNSFESRFGPVDDLAFNKLVRDAANGLGLNWKRLYNHDAPAGVPRYSVAWS